MGGGWIFQGWSKGRGGKEPQVVAGGSQTISPLHLGSHPRHYLQDLATCSAQSSGPNGSEHEAVLSRASGWNGTCTL